MRPWPGKAIAGIGLLHTLFGAVVFRPVWAAMWQERIWKTVQGEADREWAFWFLFAGMLLMLLGFLADWSERVCGRLPGCFGWSLAGLAAMMVFVMPASGAWLLFIPSAGAVVRGRKFRHLRAG